MNLKLENVFINFRRAFSSKQSIMDLILVLACLVFTSQSTILQETIIAQTMVNRELRPFRNIADIFLRLPSLQELDEIVLSADSVLILRTIQLVATKKQIDCNFKVAYLLELEGRIKSAIFKKSLQSKRFTIIYESARSQVNRLETQIEELETDKRLLFLDQKRFDLSLKIKRLESLYSQLNNATLQIEPENAKIKQNEQQMSQVMAEMDSQRQQLIKLNIELSEIEVRIQLSKSSDSFFQKEERSIKNSIRQIKTKLLDNQLKLANLDRTKAKYQSAKKSIQKNIDRLKKQITSLEVVLAGIRDDISEGQVKQDSINEKIQILQEKINKQRQKLFLKAEIQSLQFMVQSLKNRLPGINFQITRYYFNCFANGQVKDTTQNNTVVYTMNGNSFSFYFQNSYNRSFSRLINNNTIILSQINIFSNQWRSLYGSPFDAQQSLMPDPSSALTIVSDFFCLDPMKTESGEGVIVQIEKRVIMISTKDSQKLKLVLGACTRLECTNCVGDSLVIGSTLFWKGMRSIQFPDYIQVYLATAYS